MFSVSVAMATYNGRKHIGQQLESLAKQNHLPAELIVADDASDDGTISEIEKFAKTAQFPILIHRNEKRLGYRANFMRAANLCHFELVAFCDQDDVWYPKKIEVCVSRFTEPEILLVHHNADVVDEGRERKGSLDKFSEHQAVSPPLSVNPLGHSLGFTQMFRNSLLQMRDLWPMSIDHLFENERMAHDQWFYFLASMLGKIGYINEPLVAYVQHGQNIYGSSGQTNHLQLMKKYGLQNSTEQLSRRAAAADIRASILEAAAANLDKIQSERAQDGARRYRRLSTLNISRRKIYVSESFGERLAALLKLLTSGGYGGNWNLSYKSLIKDVCTGVPIGPSLSRAR